MNIFYKSMVTAAFLSLLGACVSMPGASETAKVDERACAKSFAVEGSALSITGTKYSTSMFVPGVSVKVAMDRASKQIAMDGMTITTLDREGGLIAASNKVIAGKGDTVPLVSTFEAAKGGVQVRLKFANGFGQVTTEETVRNGFCNIISAIEKK